MIKIEKIRIGSRFSAARFHDRDGEAFKVRSGWAFFSIERIEREAL
jgi:hypothetical protein